jgi:DNA-binding XRE family transcriptional regulator
VSEKNPEGRPTKFKPEFVKQAYEMALLGITDAQMAAIFDVTEQTLNNWKKEIPEFFESLKEGKHGADAKVAQSLYKRATGYEHKAVKISSNPNGDEHVTEFTERFPPDTTAAIFWLKNRQPDMWRDVQRKAITDTSGNDIERRMGADHLRSVLEAALDDAPE